MTALTNGCFDLCHLGHLDFLRRAAALGGGLVTVALNTDASVRRLKGADRPFVPCDDRARVLELLPFVDAVHTFDTEDDLRALIDRLRPDVLVKGSDYAGRPIAGADVVASYGGTVALLPLMPNRSTSALVAKIRGLIPESKLVAMAEERSDGWGRVALAAAAAVDRLQAHIAALSNRAVDAEAAAERLRARMKQMDADLIALECERHRLDQLVPTEMRTPADFGALGRRIR